MPSLSVLAGSEHHQGRMKKSALIFSADFSLHIKGRVHGIDILLVQFLPEELYSFTKPLEMDDFPLPQEFNYITHIRVITQSQDVVIGYPCLLLCQGAP